MPVREYECPSCGRFDHLETRGSAQPARRVLRCPTCQEPSKLRVSNFSVVDGHMPSTWYKDDSRCANDGNLQFLAYNHRKQIHPKKEPSYLRAQKILKTQRKTGRAFNALRDRT